MRDGDIDDLMNLNEATVPTGPAQEMSPGDPWAFEPVCCFVLEAFSLISPVS